MDTWFPEPGAVELAIHCLFLDPVNDGAECTLVIPLTSAKRAAVAHPHCTKLADLSADLDAFFCRSCHQNGRISGAWATDMIERAEKLLGMARGTII